MRSTTSRAHNNERRTARSTPGDDDDDVEFSQLQDVLGDCTLAFNTLDEICPHDKHSSSSYQELQGDFDTKMDNYKSGRPWLTPVDAEEVLGTKSFIQCTIQRNKRFSQTHVPSRLQTHPLYSERKIIQWKINRPDDYYLESIDNGSLLPSKKLKFSQATVDIGTTDQTIGQSERITHRFTKESIRFLTGHPFYADMSSRMRISRIRGRGREAVKKYLMKQTQGDATQTAQSE